jgi:hypothetical protein
MPGMRFVSNCKAGLQTLRVESRVQELAMSYFDIDKSSS